MIGQAVELARAHTALLLITTPVVGAALAAAIPSARLSWTVAVAAATLGAVLAIDLAFRVLLGGAAMPAAPALVPLHVDGLAIFAATLAALTGLLAMIAGGASIADLNPRVAPFAMALALLVIAGWTGGLLANDVVGLLMGVEIAWLASVGLLALGGDGQPSALNAALRMLVIGGAGAAFMFFGAGLAYRGAGTLVLADLPLARMAAPGAAGAGFGLMLVGLLLKAGVAPMHAWASAAYSRANGLAALTLGVTGAVGALAVIAKLSGYALQAPGVGEGASLALACVGGLSVVIGSVQAIGAQNLRRLAAYAGAAQGGAVLISIALGSPAGFAAALIQLTALAAGALALFAGAAASGVYALTSTDGLGRRAPLASLAMTCGALSLMGAPLTIGFLGRWRMVEAGVGAGWWWAVGAVTVASLAGVLYGGRLIERLYFRRAETPHAGASNGLRIALAPALVAAIVAIGLALSPVWLLDAANAASAFLVGGGP